MKKIAETVSYLALVLLVAAPILFYGEKITLETNKLLLIIATIAWFVTAIYWMNDKKQTD